MAHPNCDLVLIFKNNVTVLDENIPFCAKYQSARLEFTPLYIAITIDLDEWPFPACDTYPPPARQGEPREHKLCYRGITHIFNGAPNHFTISGCRKDVHIRFGSHFSSLLFYQTLSSFVLEHDSGVWMKLFQPVTQRNLIEFLGHQHYQQFIELRKALSKSNALFWINVGFNQLTQGPQEHVHGPLEEWLAYNKQHLFMEGVGKVVHQDIYRNVAAIRAKMEDYRTLRVETLLTKYTEWKLAKMAAELGSCQTSTTPTTLRGQASITHSPMTPEDHRAEVDEILGLPPSTPIVMMEELQPKHRRLEQLQNEVNRVKQSIAQGWMSFKSVVEDKLKKN